MNKTFELQLDKIVRGVGSKITLAPFSSPNETIVKEKEKHHAGNQQNTIEQIQNSQVSCLRSPGSL